jgi:hypothetical protein
VFSFVITRLLRARFDFISRKEDLISEGVKKPLPSDYSKAIDYLKDYLAYLKDIEGVSARAIARELGLKSSGSLSLILNQKRPLQAKTFTRLKYLLPLTDQERHDLQSIYETELLEGASFKRDFV